MILSYRIGFPSRRHKKAAVRLGQAAFKTKKIYVRFASLNLPLHHPPHQPRKHLPRPALHELRHAVGEHQSFTFCQHFLNSRIITPIIPKRKHENRFIIVTIND
jgi:hypothetical protein